MVDQCGEEFIGGNKTAKGLVHKVEKVNIDVIKFYGLKKEWK